MSIGKSMHSAQGQPVHQDGTNRLNYVECTACRGDLSTAVGPDANPGMGTSWVHRPKK